ncbi:MAG TPA: hypothetical protein PLW44_15220 [Chitinophagales bacterium]|nr:hypothetical protein [Chitinophagales bacterium]
MITRGKRQNGKPIFITENNIQKLERVAVEDKLFNEEWLQRLIYDNPGLLPIDEIESSFSPLIAAGREIATSVGYIDNLYFSPNGYITIVETKLWRNSEARRTVVSQILDYAKELSKWSFEDLNTAIVKSSQLYNNNNDGLLEIYRKNFQEETDEIAFTDGISRSLNRGRFLLLIVGDGIQENTEAMVDYINQNPQLQFTLALIELQVFKNENSRIVIPQVISRTREITRAVIKIENNAGKDIQINVLPGEVATDRPEKTASRFKISADDFFEALTTNTDTETVDLAKQIIKDSEENNWQIEWNTGSFSVKLIDPMGSGIKISLFSVDRSGLIYPGLSKIASQQLNIDPKIGLSYIADTAKLFPGLKLSQGNDYWSKYQKLKALKLVYPQFFERVKEYVHSIYSSRSMNEL